MSTALSVLTHGLSICNYALSVYGHGSNVCNHVFSTCSNELSLYNYGLTFRSDGLGVLIMVCAFVVMVWRLWS